jgi:uncharacterized protein (DUF58 family)
VTRRARLALLVGAAVYLAAWAFGSKALYPVAVGVLLAVLLAWAWVRLCSRPVRLSWGSGQGEHVEGDDIEVAIELELEAGWPSPPPAALAERSRLGARTTPLERRGRRLTGSYVLEAVPRGRYRLEQATAVLEDPFGLERVEVELSAGSTLLVYPRLTELDNLFSGTGPGALGGRRLLLHRPSGFEFHSVREYEQGESLRRVHWPSTAKRGELMVKELEDAPRDEVVVLLDAACGSIGRPPDSSFDMQVRVAGSVLLSHLRRGRRSLLVLNRSVVETAQVSGADGDRAGALELLAAAEPDGRISAAALLAAEGLQVAGSLETTIVTSALAPQLIDRLYQRTHSRRRVSLVYVEPQSFAGRTNGREPGLLRLQAAGIPVAVVRRGDDLAEVLGAAQLRVAAYG